MPIAFNLVNKLSRLMLNYLSFGFSFDMPGAPSEPLNDNNRELTAKEWFKHYDRPGKYIKVYHAKNKKEEQ